MAEICIQLIAQQSNWKPQGSIYHYANEGFTSWYDFAVTIMEISNSNFEIIPIETFEYKTSAKRPQYSVLNKRLIKEDFGVETMHWGIAIKEMLKKNSY